MKSSKLLQFWKKLFEDWKRILVQIAKLARFLARIDGTRQRSRGRVIRETPHCFLPRAEQLRASGRIEAPRGLAHEAHGQGHFPQPMVRKTGRVATGRRRLQVPAGLRYVQAIPRPNGSQARQA